MTDIERRFVDLQTTVTGRKLGGYAAVYRQITDIGYYLEQLAPTAFRSVLQSDVRGLLNHDPNHLLARTANGTLKLSSDSHGLEFELTLPDTTLGNDVRAMVDSGLITGCSFGFVPNQQEWTTHEGRDLRTHVEVAKLLDVSVVTFPAYEGTNVALRSKPTESTIDGRTQMIVARHVTLMKGQ